MALAASGDYLAFAVLGPLFAGLALERVLVKKFRWSESKAAVVALLAFALVTMGLLLPLALE